MSKKIAQIMQKFIMSNPDRALKFFASRSAEWWEKQGEKKALETFHEAAEKVPAYRDFLIKNGIKDHTKIQTIEDFKKYIPITTKENYILAYPFKDRLIVPYENLFTISTTSGTTGEPVYWPRLGMQDKMFSYFYEMILRNMWQIHKIPTLVIVGLSLGNYIAGELNTFCWKEIALRNKNKITVVTPGSDIEGILEILKEFIDKYEQIIIISYPSLLKLLLDEGEKEGINWQRYKIRWLYGGELCPRKLLEKIKEKILGKKIDYSFAFTAYGAADAAGGIGFANPFTVIVNELLEQYSKLKNELGLEREDIYSEVSLCQLNTLTYFVEEVDERLTITFNGAVPLVRYNIKDIGKIIPFTQLITVFEKEKINIFEILKEKIPYYYVFKQPLLNIVGRDSAISLDGANVFPSQIAEIIESSPWFNSFKISKKILEDGNSKFVVYLELKDEKKPSQEEVEKLKIEYHDKILNYLLKINTDFRKSYHDNLKLCDPEIVIRKFRELEFAPSKSGKIKYVI
jgi:phenylacetate-CoA ligase